MTATFTGEVHPYAARFPMLSNDDLDALAADIAAHGLLHPLVLTPDGALLDGRNRLTACDRAGVKPDFITYEGEPVAFVIGQNMQRRDLTQAQKAHLAVAGLSDSDNRRQEDMAAIAGVPRTHIAEALVVRRYAPDAADAVIAQTVTHDAAYQMARDIKDHIKEAERREATLRSEAPDLLDKGLVLDEAWAAYLKRTEDERKQRQQHADWIKKLRDSLVDSVLAAGDCAHPANIAATLEGLRAERTKLVTPQTLREAADHLTKIADLMEAAA